jgi:hypothetical protein
MCSDLEKLLKFEAEGQEFVKKLRSLQQLIRTVKGATIFGTESFLSKVRQSCIVSFKPTILPKNEPMYSFSFA